MSQRAAGNAVGREQRALGSWYRHLIYAPAPTYAADLLPGVAEAAAAGDRRQIANQVARLAAALDRAAAILRSTE